MQHSPGPAPLGAVLFDQPFSAVLAVAPIPAPTARPQVFRRPDRFVLLVKASTGFFALFAAVLMAGFDGNFGVVLFAFIWHVTANDRLALFFWFSPSFRVAFAV